MLDDERIGEIRHNVMNMVKNWDYLNPTAVQEDFAELLDEIGRLQAELEQWRNGTRVRSSVDVTLMGFGVDDYDELFEE